jgi:polyhydroxybutyrate depolymerase
MITLSALACALLAFTSDPPGPGDHSRSVRVAETTRPYLLHVPPSYDPQVPTPLVLALHPFATNGPMMARISGLGGKADEAGFLVAYPNGTGKGPVLRWNVGVGPKDEADDVAYIAAVLDDLAAVANVDPKRVYATGFSNGGMMCYRLASALSGRIAAIAPVAGTMTDREIEATRPVPVLHFHGTKDTFVSYDGRLWRDPASPRIKGVEETVRSWAKHDGCPEEPATAEVPRGADDGLIIKRVAYGPGRDGSEVVLYVIEGGGHTWPGREPIGAFLGKSAEDLKANDLIWEFFRDHPLP